MVWGIVIVLNLFFNYALSLAYEAPEYNNFCKNEQVVPTVTTEAQCTTLGGQWNANVYDAVPKNAQPAGYCDQQFTCRQDYEAARKTYDRNIFTVLVILGALSVLAGTLFKSNAVISSGLSLAGVFSFIIASLRYWGSAGSLVRVVILAIALGILFWIAMKKFNDRVRS